MRGLVRILVFFILIFFLYSGVVLFIGKASLAETNYQNNKIKLERLLKFSKSKLGDRKIELCLVGTSLTGRLLDKNFTKSVLNFGFDGLSPLTILELLNKTNFSCDYLLLEINLLDKKPDNNDMQILSLFDDRFLRIKTRFEILQTERRPSSVLYNFLKNKRDGFYKSSKSVKTAGVDFNNVDYTEKFNDIEKFENIYLQDRLVELDKYRFYISEFEKRGTELIFFSLPDGNRNTNSNYAEARNVQLMRKIMQNSELRYFNLRKFVADSGIKLSYSDGIHLDVYSARKMIFLIENFINKVKKQKR